MPEQVDVRLRSQILNAAQRLPSQRAEYAQLKVDIGCRDIQFGERRLPRRRCMGYRIGKQQRGCVSDDVVRGHAERDTALALRGRQCKADGNFFGN